MGVDLKWGEGEESTEEMEFDLTGMETVGPNNAKDAEESGESITHLVEEATKSPSQSAPAGAAAAGATQNTNPLGLSAEMLTSFNQFQALLAAQSGGTAEAKAHRVLQNMLDAMNVQPGSSLDNPSPVDETTEFQRQPHPPRAHDQSREEAGTSERDNSEGQEGGHLASGHMPD